MTIQKSADPPTPPKPDAPTAEGWYDRILACGDHFSGTNVTVPRKCDIIAAIRDAEQAAAAKARKEQMEDDCKAICPQCRACEEVVYFLEDRWIHPHPMGATCKASQIRFRFLGEVGE